MREYKKQVGEPYAEERGSAIEIKVLGPGCTRCDNIEQDLMAVMAETGVAADLEHVRDPLAIADYGIIGTPALMINNKVVSVGTVPTKSQLKAWLAEAAANR